MNNARNDKWVDKPPVDWRSPTFRTNLHVGPQPIRPRECLIGDCTDKKTLMFHLRLGVWACEEHREGWGIPEKPPAHLALNNFFLSCKHKYGDKVKEGRSERPWEDYDYDFLVRRLMGEIQEMIPAMHTGTPDEFQDELLDVANFCAFIWLLLEGEK